MTSLSTSEVVLLAPLLFLKGMVLSDDSDIDDSEQQNIDKCNDC